MPRIAATEHPQEKVERALRSAKATNDTYLAIGSPTNAQNLAQIRALSRQMNNVIRIIGKQLDGNAD